VTGLPFALFVFALVVWSLVLLVGTLGSLDQPEDSEDEA
jgi:hypothetical protein